MQGQRIVILGGTHGIGLAVADQAARAGARVIVASSQRASVDAALGQLPGAEGHAVDLRSAAAIQALFGALGPIDHLVYTAGEPLLIAPLAGLDLAEARRFFELRYWGALAAVQAAQVRRSIVLTGGTAAVRPPPGFALGASICGAMASLTRALALELAPVRVNLVVPGFVETELWRTVPEATRGEMFRAAAARLPVGRIGTPADIAEHYLAFLRGAYTTGQSIIVDGGGVLAG